ncbi:MAG: hypothetical protein H7843_02965 [Nitrospirota bacterium]
MSEDDIKNTLGVMPNSFTELIIEDVSQDILDYLSSSNFEVEISKVLPIGIREKEPFLENISDSDKRIWIENLFKDTAYCPTIDMYLGIRGENEIVPLYKYFPTFKQDIPFEEPNILCGTSDDNNFKYFILFTTEDLKADRENKETGFWVRSRNFLVKAADFFQQPGSKSKFIDEPLKNWIYGEIYHKNMKSFLNVLRTDYVWDSKDFLDFKKSVHMLVSDLNKPLRIIWKYSAEVEKSIISPFLEIRSNKGPFYNAAKTISDMGIDCDGEEAEKILYELSKKRDEDMEKCIEIDDLINQAGSDQIVLADDENIKVVIDKKLHNGRISHKSMNLRNGTTQAIIKISPALFKQKEIIFLTKTFKVIFVAGAQSNTGISIDISSYKIYVNPFNHDLMKYSVSFIDVYIAIELAHLKAKTKDEMKDYLLKLLGRNYYNSKKFMLPLSDDLRRKMRGRRK